MVCTPTCSAGYRAPAKTREALPYIRKRLDLLPFDKAAHRDLMAALAACGRIAEAQAHLEAAIHLLSSQGLSCAGLDKALREHRQLAARGTPHAVTESEPGHLEKVGASRRVGAASGAAAPRRLSCCPSPTSAAIPTQEYFVDGVTESPDHGPLADLRLVRHRPPYGLHLQRQACRREGDRARAERPIRPGGSVQRDDARMRVNVQLIDAESGTHLWARGSERAARPFSSTCRTRLLHASPIHSTRNS